MPTPEPLGDFIFLGPRGIDPETGKEVPATYLFAKYPTTYGLPARTDISGGLGGFGLSGTRVAMTGEVERARLDILERMKRTTDSRAKSRLTLPRLFGDGNKEKNILADVL